MLTTQSSKLPRCDFRDSRLPRQRPTVDPKTGKLVPQWHREGHYDAIAERLFNTLKHDRLLLEYDSKRAGSFEPLKNGSKE